MLLGLIQTISNFPVSLILTITMVVLLALSVLFGFIRGVRKSLFYSVFYVIAFAGFILAFPMITTMIVNMFIGQIADMLRSILSGFNGADLSNMFVNGTASYAMLLTFVSFGVQIALCFAFVLLFEVFYKIIIWLFWVLIGKRFAKTKIKKHGKIIRKSKQRIFGGIVGILPGILSVIMVFVPISGIFSIASSFTRVEKKESVSFGGLLNEKDYAALQDSLNSYDKSLPGMIFNMSTSKDGRSLDLVLLDRFITVRIDDREFNIRRDIEKLGEFSATMASTGLLDIFNGEELTINELVSTIKEDEELLESAFSKLGDVEFIDLVLNTGVEYLDNSRLIDEKLELASDSVNYDNLSNLDWSSEFAQFGKITIATIELLDVLPEEEKTKPLSELKSFNLASLENADSIKVDEALTNFADTLFESTLINEASTAGLAYVFEMDSIKEIVGEIDKEELKKIELKNEIVSIIDALVSVINIGVSDLKELNLKSLSMKSDHLHNLINSVLGLSLFELVETNVLNYVIDNHIANNENASKFIDVEELRESVNTNDEANRLDIKKELNAIVTVFERLGKETKVFDVEVVEGEEPKKFNMEAINSKALSIINDYISDSKQIQKFTNKLMEGALVPALFEQDEYDTLVNKPGFSWYDIKDGETVVENCEISVLVKLLEAIEKEYLDHPDGKEFSIFSMINSDEKEFTLAMLKGLTAKVEGEDDEYVLDTSLFTSEMIAKLLEDAGEGNELLDDIKDNPDIEGHYGRELSALARILEESEIVTNKYENIDFASLADEFTTLTEKKITAIGNNIGDSELIKGFIIDKLGPSEGEDGILSQETVDEMETWTKEDWKREFDVLANVIFDETGGLSDGKSEMSLDDFNAGFDKINYYQLDVISENINNSVIVQELLSKSLEDGGFEIKDDMNWKEEVEVIRDIVGSETYLSSGEYKDMNINELSSFDKIRPETLAVISKNINKSSIIKNTLVDPMRSIMGIADDAIVPTDPSDETFKNYPENWTDEEWEYELKSLSYVAKPLAKPDATKESEGYPITNTYIDINNIDIGGKIKVEVLESLKGGMDSDLGILARIKTRILRSGTPDIDNYNFGIHKSYVLRKMFKDALSKSYDVDFSTYTNNDYYYEVDALIGVIVDGGLSTIDPLDGQQYVVFDELTDNIGGSGDSIKLEVLDAVRNNISKSKLLQQVMEDNLEDMMNTYIDGSTIAKHKYNFDSWTGSKWTQELTSLYEVAETISTIEDGEKVIKIKGDMIGSKIKYTTISVIKENSHSEILRHALRETIDDLINGIENSVENDKTISCLPIYIDTASDDVRYSGWNDNQWKYEMNVLHMLVENMAQEKVNKGEYSNINDVELDPSTFGESLTSFDKVFLGKIQEKVYGTLEGLSTKFNSYILQSQLVSAMEEVMNSGDSETGVMRNRFRKLYPVIGDYNYDEHTNKVGLNKYSAYDPNNDTAIGEWWNNNLPALYAIVDAKFADGEKIPAGDIKFNEVNIEVLNIVRDNIEHSYILQSAMRSTTEGMINQDNYDDITTEDWTRAKWKVETTAIRDVSKTLAKKQAIAPDPLPSVKIKNSLIIKRCYDNKVKDSGYNENNWVKDETEDKMYVFNLNDLDIKDESTSDNVPLDTLYYVSKYADCSQVIRRMLRQHIVELMELPTTNGVAPAFEQEWLVQGYPGDTSGNEYANRWRYEMEALYNVANKMSFDGVDRFGKFTKVITLKTDMFDNIPLSVFDTLNGAFDENHIIDESSDDHGYVSNRGGIEYQSKVLSKLLTKSLTSTNINPETWTNDQWAYEIYALSHVIAPLAVDGKVNIKNINFDDGVNMAVLANLKDVIHASSYLQDKLNESIFTNRATYTEYPATGFSTSKNQWNDEIGALYIIINDTKYVEDGLFKFNNLDFSSSIDMKVLNNVSTVIHKSTYMQYKLDSSLFTENIAAYPQVGYLNEDAEQWQNEIKTIHDIVNDTHYVSAGVFNYGSLNFDAAQIDVKLLKKVGDKINYSTYLQSKLESTLEGLVTTDTTDVFYILDRSEYFEKDFASATCEHKFNGEWDHECTVCGYIKDYHLNDNHNGTYSFDLRVTYNEEHYHAWSVELKTIFGIITDPKSGLVSYDTEYPDGYVNIEEIADELHSLNVNVINVTADKLDEFGHDAYHSSNIVRLNLIRPLEILAKVSDANDGIAPIKFDLAEADHGFKWIDIPETTYTTHSFNFVNNGAGKYEITSNFHRFDGDIKEFSISGNELNIELTGWKKEISGTTQYIYDLKETLEYDSSTGKYIKYGLDRDGNQVIEYMMDINESTMTGNWYCINNYSDLHEVSTLFKLLGASTLEEATTAIALGALTNSFDSRITNNLRTESYYVDLIFDNYGIL